jgi:hypothetical protein
MATTDNIDITSNEQKPVYLSHEEAKEVARGAPDSIQRILWPLDSRPLRDAISVMASTNNPDVLEPYYNEDTGKWHEISKLPLKVPKVSSIEVSVDELESWESDWLECHEDHFLPDEEAEPGMLEWEVLERPKHSDGGVEEDDVHQESELRVLKCCGSSRPIGKDAKLLVTPDSDGDGFVTLRDYLSAVHPWLMAPRQDILDAQSVYEDTQWSVDPEVVINYSEPGSLWLEIKDEWARQRKGVPLYT